MFQLWEEYEGKDGNEWRKVGDPLPMEPSRRSSPEQRMMFIEPPVVPFYGQREGFFRGKPPLGSQADLNLQHWQKKSDVDNIERIANVPILVLEGGEGDTGEMADLEIGAYRLVGVPDGRSLKYLEINGSGITHAKDSIRHLEEHIRLVGKEPMIQKATGTELATVRLLNEASAMTQAQVWALSWVESINRCLDLTAAWMGIPTAGSVSIAEDVLEALARPEGFDEVLQIHAQGGISSEGLLEEAKRYGVVDRDFDVEEDAERRGSAPPLI
jgi:hypothetical protein